MNRSANIHDFNLLDSHLDNTMEDFEITSKPLAFIYFVLGRKFGLDEFLEIDEFVTDGSYDCGIDAFFFDEENAHFHFFSFKYATDFEKTRRNFEENETHKLTRFFTDLFDLNIDPFRKANSKIQNMVKLFHEKIEKKEIETYSLHLVSNKLPLQEDQEKRFSEELKRDFHICLSWIGLKQLTDLASPSPEISGDLQAPSKEHFLHTTSTNIQGVVTTVSALEYLKLVCTDGDLEKGVNDAAFEENIRPYLSSNRNKINRQIKETALSSDNNLFWYLNNGITIVCEDIDYAPKSPIIKLSKLQIVNGCQTTNALYDAYCDDSIALSDAELLVKIFKSNDKEFIMRVTQTTNSQNAIYARDLKANDQIQCSLDAQFAAMGYKYYRKRKRFGERTQPNDINNQLAAQICHAFYNGEPSEAKAKKKDLFETLYEDIFDDKITAVRILVPYQIHKYILSKQKENAATQDLDFLSHSSFHILYILKNILESKQLLSDDSALKDDSFREQINKNVHDLYDDAIIFLKTIVLEQKQDEKYTHNNFFKTKKSTLAIESKLKHFL